MMRYPSSGFPSILRANSTARRFVPIINISRRFLPWARVRASINISTKRPHTRRNVLMSQNDKTTCHGIKRIRSNSHKVHEHITPSDPAFKTSINCDRRLVRRRDSYKLKLRNKLCQIGITAKSTRRFVTFTRAEKNCTRDAGPEACSSFATKSATHIKPRWKILEAVSRSLRRTGGMIRRGCGRHPWETLLQGCRPHYSERR